MTHLNTGTGYACARHNSVILESIMNSTNSIVLVGTFGGALFIGSTRKYKHVNDLVFTWTEALEMLERDTAMSRLH